MGIVSILDGREPDAAVMISHASVVATEGGPLVVWRREERASETGAVTLSQPGAEAIELDRGEVDEPVAAAGEDGRWVALWMRRREPGGGAAVACCGPLVGGMEPRVLSGRGSASHPAVAVNAVNTVNVDSGVLAAWSRIEGRGQVVEAAAGPALDGAVRLSSGRWAARPAACALAGGEFLVVWDELAPGGGAVGYALLASDGRVLRRGEAFSGGHPAVRFLHATCAPFEGGALVSAVRVEDGVSVQGVVDQSHTVVTARLGRDGSLEPLDPEVRLDHGLVPDPGRRDEVWGYLGNRLRPALLPGGRLWWERKELHEGRTTTTRGVLCCKAVGAAGTWSEERIIHAGGLGYHMDRDESGARWLVHREVIQDRTHRLALERIETGAEAVSTYGWAEPTGYSRLEWTPPRTPPARGSRQAEAPASESDLRLYWGDPHVHSALSLDCEGEPDELLYYARHRAGLDFVALTENDEMYSCWLTRTERERGCDLAEAWTEDGVFVALNGFEYTRPTLDEPYKNHRTVLLPDRRRGLFRWSDPVRPEEEGRIAGKDHTGLDGLAAEAERLDAVLISHHPVWRLSGSGRETALEAVSAWDTYIHDPSRIHAAWAAGRRLGLIGGADGHRRTAGLAGACTGVWARELTLEGIMEGIRERRTIATQGRRPRIRFSVTDERGAALIMGGCGRLEGELTVGIDVETEPGRSDAIELVELRHGERVLANWSRSDAADGGRRLSVEYSPFSYDTAGKRIPLSLDPPAYLYLRIRFSGPDDQLFSNVAPAWGPWAWTSPIWWTVRSPGGASC